ncbi:aspartyl protease family protein [Polaribacter ponticola]|uniref:Aspartyl protease family protein n=1 Tax=Polaribacter ponticola TaxID=2978475 RepID=A0ABT5S4G4_9FLAO|nr:aspartyl protease family protein [Polaribacter sp. MSW5]MDD7912998.1 aspartyl protease family protein [Polaribacter sp. MSW5]
MKKTFKLFLILFFAFSVKVKAQDGFHFINKNKVHQQISFKLINNLIVIPLHLNDKKLHFILDTGVNKTILFNISQNDSIGLNNVKKVKLQGLGKGESIDALMSLNNNVSIKKIASKTETIYVILKDNFDLSSKMGTTIHGIIGYDLLKEFILKINYKSQTIDFYNPNKFKYRKCKKCEVFPLKLFRNKPYMNLKVQLDTIGNKLIDVKMLIDSGGSDAVWLFEDSKEDIKTPKQFFNDILGEGLSGAIYGNRSRMPKIKMGSFEIENPTVSFLDSLSTKNARTFKDRNGSIGAGILKRFKVWIDYPNKKITLKKSGSFSGGFNYNMSGLDVIYYGKQLVKEENVKSYSNNASAGGENSINFITSFSYKFKPSFIVNSVVENSPAEKAGLLKDDIILKINGKRSYEFTLNDIMFKFQQRDNKKIKIEVSRNGKK